jgi:hypothetical protein
MPPLFYAIAAADSLLPPPLFSRRAPFSPLRHYVIFAADAAFAITLRHFRFHLLRFSIFYAIAMIRRLHFATADAPAPRYTMPGAMPMRAITRCFRRRAITPLPA